MEKENVKWTAFLQLPMEILMKHTRLMKWEGVVLILLGILAIAMPLVFSQAVEFILGILLIIGGISGLTRSFKAKDIPGTIVSVLFYLLFVVAGVLLIKRPMVGVLTLAVIVGCFFLISGFFKMIFAFNIKPARNWGWSLLDGILCIILGSLIFSEWPVAGPVIIGVLVGIRLIFLGNSMIMIAGGLQYAAKNSAAVTAESEPFPEESEVKPAEEETDEPEKDF